MQSHNSTNAEPSSVQIELLLRELNEASGDINSSEKCISAAFVRKKYLMDSIPEFSNLSEPIIEVNSARLLYYQLRADQDTLKRKIDTQIAKFCQLTSDYEMVRREFDLLAHSSSSKEKGASRSLAHDDQRRLSACSVEVLAAQLNRDACENEYTRLMGVYRSSMVEISRVEKLMGRDASKRTSAQYSVVERVNQQIVIEDEEIEKLHVQIEMHKRRYRGAMMRLEEVSNSLHEQPSNSPIA